MNHSRNRFIRLAALLPLISAASVVRGEQADAQAQTAGPPATPTAVAATAAARPVRELPPPSEAEAQFGIQVARVSVTAASGLVDVRLKVLDAAKVKALLADSANAPSLVVGDKPPLMAPRNALKGARLSDGQVIFVLFPNVRRAVQAGVPVTVAMGPARLGPVTAQ
jgi:hypothetical protein